MADELISRQAAIKLLRGECVAKYPSSFSFGLFAAADELSKLTAVDAVEVVHGWWDNSGRYQFPSGAIAVRCSECGCALQEGEFNLYNWNYCPVCGAKMDGKRREENEID